MFKDFNAKLNRVHQKQKKPVQIGDVKYESLKEAAQAMGVSATTIFYRIKEKKLFKGKVCSYIPRS